MLTKKQKEIILRVRKELYSIAKELGNESVQTKQFTHSYHCTSRAINAVEELAFDEEILDRETLEEI